VRAAEGGRFPAHLWSEVEEAGLTQALVPEAKGGSGLGFEDAAVVLQIAARHAAPIPLGESLIAACLLAESGLDIPDGPLAFAGANLEAVPWGRDIRHVVMVAGGKLRLYRRADLKVTEGRNLALEPRDALALGQAKPIAEAKSGADPLLLGAFLRSLQIAGAMAALVDIGVGYANERVQFGKPIGKYQAIQHQLAELAAEAAAADVAARAAARALDHGRNATQAIAAAKIRAGEAAGRGPRIAHQVMGAIGFTYEHHLHFLTRRLWAWRAEYGHETAWAEKLGAEICQVGAEGFWPALVGR